MESQPDDGGVAIAKETAAKLGLRLESKFNKWPGLYAAQYQWALDNLPIEAEWVLRLDADEYLTDETMETLRQTAGSSSSGSPTANTRYPLARTSARSAYACGRFQVSSFRLERKSVLLTAGDGMLYNAHYHNLNYLN